MKNYIKLFAPLTMAILIGSLTFIFAQTKTNNFGDPNAGDRKERRMPPPNGLDPRLLEQLNLTDAQKEQIQALEINSRDAAKGNFEKVRGFDEQLKTPVESGNFNEDQARQILSDKAKAMTEMEIVRLRTDAAVFKILTTEQKAQLEQLKQQRPDFGCGARPGMPPQN